MIKLLAVERCFAYDASEARKAQLFFARGTGDIYKLTPRAPSHPSAPRRGTQTDTQTRTMSLNDAILPCNNDPEQIEEIENINNCSTRDHLRYARNRRRSAHCRGTDVEATQYAHLILRPVALLALGPVLFAEARLQAHVNILSS